MEIIYSDNIISDDIIEKCLEKLLPKFKIFNYDYSAEEARGFDVKNKQHIIFDTFFDDKKIEFGFCITVYRTPEENSEERSIEIARSISEKIKGRILIAYSLPSEPNYPYYDLILSDGEYYLADDFDTNFGDGTQGFVKLLKQVRVNNFQFNKNGELIK